uniref:class I SAM-dependent methyltransferase n=1 Tax=Gelidibacter sp. TaxID=2018083 RepID=UPI00404AC985
MDYLDKSVEYFSFPRHEMLTYLPKTSTKVLEVGCGRGTFAKQIKDYNNAEVWGIELVESEANLAETILDKVFIGKCEDIIKNLPNEYFNAIYFNDVLEHLVDPYWVLSEIKQKLTTNGLIISSIPNIRNFRVIKKLVVNGDFEYTDKGIMDRTHMRFFTKKSIKNMYENLGYKVLSNDGINPSKSLKPYLYNIPLLFRAMDMKYTQFATVAQKV